ncbi:hypothetical protein NX059_012001 [Plenodomus lindquistii]|nr:hypothetical protein NX059_012001 [Plenodomus lindquistii]
MRLGAQYLTGYNRFKSTSSPPALPAELWARIFSHLNDRTLWINCRNVSNTWRAEAEGVMRRDRLQAIRICWKYVVEHDSKTYSGRCKTQEVAKSSNNEQRVFFHLLWTVYVCNQPRTSRQSGRWDWNDSGRDTSLISQLPETVQKLMSAKLSQNYNLYREYVPQGRIVNLGIKDRGFEVPGIDFDSETGLVSVLWKPFLTEFLGDGFTRRQVDMMTKKDAIPCEQFYWRLQRNLFAMHWEEIDG